MKRLLLTMGDKAVRNFVMRHKTDADYLFDAFMQKYISDSNREDIFLSKCMHCFFKRACMKTPNFCSFIDERTPIHQLAFNVITRNSRRFILAYDCGWIIRNNNGDRKMMPENAVMPDEFSDVMFPEYQVKAFRPFSLNLSRCRAVPKRGESYDAFKKRIDAVIEKFKKETATTSMTLRQKMMLIIKSTGHEEELKNIYEGNLEFLLSDWWPDMSMQEIVNLYEKKSDEVSMDDFIKNRKRIEQELEKEASDV